MKIAILSLSSTCASARRLLFTSSLPQQDFLSKFGLETLESRALDDEDINSNIHHESSGSSLL
jgi:hypothetical protein